MDILVGIIKIYGVAIFAHCVQASVIICQIHIFRNIMIDIGAGNDANSIFVHDTLNIIYEQKAIEDATEEIWKICNNLRIEKEDKGKKSKWLG